MALLVTAGSANPFGMADRLIVCSYHFASAKAQEISHVPWDLVVIDEAHRLRNVYRKSSKLARSVVDAVAHAPKLLVTATPLQNSLMELYGLASVIDDHIFGDAASFRDQFVRAADERQRNTALRDRLRPICIRTLRKQVVEYIPFTRRVAVTQDFRPGDEEHALYESLSAYLQRDGLIALPAGQRTLITLVLRKLLASSTFAIAKTLDRLVARLEGISSNQALLLDDEDVEGVDELLDELEEQEEDAAGDNPQKDRPIDPEILKAELAELRGFIEMARRITVNAKGEALIPGLKIAFERAEQYTLFDLLSARGYKDQLVMINGSNSDPHSGSIYRQWRERHAGQEVVTGSRSVDIRAAIVEHFRDYATILVATEAAAEGVNLQFCSLVVNYDLLWNPQRIEQRIARCHRYGPKHDVVVVNFLNRRNEADQRVLELLSEKFKLFDGVFGASDEIKAAFDKLQAELEEQIQSRMAQTREVLLEHFDEDVSARLRENRDKTLETLSNRERNLLELTRTELNDEARFEADRPRFLYSGARARQGWYHFDWKEAEKTGDTFYRQDHPLAAQLIEQSLDRDLPPATVALDYAAHRQVISILKREIKEFDKQIREARRTTALAASLHNKLEAQKAIKALESARNRKRRDLFDAQDAIDSQRDELIGRIEKQLQQRHSSKPVFTFRWRLA